MSRPLSLKSITQAFSVAELAVVDDQYLLPAIPTNPFSGRVSHDADPGWPRLTRLSSSRMFGSRQSVYSHRAKVCCVAANGVFQDSQSLSLGASHPYKSSQIICHTIIGYGKPRFWPAYTRPELAILPSTWAENRDPSGSIAEGLSCLGKLNRLSVRNCTEKDNQYRKQCNQFSKFRQAPWAL